MQKDFWDDYDEFLNVVNSIVDSNLNYSKMIGNVSNPSMLTFPPQILYNQREMQKHYVHV